MNPHSEIAASRLSNPWAPPSFADGRSAAPDPLVFQKKFGNSNPVEIEIGCGKGKFLVDCAAENPARNYWGVDRVGKWMKIGVKKGEKRNLGNLVFLKTEIREFLRRVPPASVKGFHIYFPDPWPKRRHRKRRLVTEAFLHLLNACLQPSGFVQLATDDADYFGQMKAAAAGSGSWRITESVNRRLAYEAAKTNYELKYEAAGKPLYYLELVKE